jgi:DNA polymerase elongation subunit (family B)
LYPNTYRTLNLSPECIIGQFTNFEDDWRGIKNRDDKEHVLEFDNPKLMGCEVLCADGATWREVLIEKQWAITAYGTVIDQSKGPGVIPRLLGDWYADRKKKQKLAKEHQAKAKQWLDNGGSKTDQEYINEYTLYEYFDLLQHTKKISLNSLYGATLNEYCRFHDPRLGASTTGSGRQITTHMIQTLSTLITGKEFPLEKTRDEEGKALYKIPYESHVLYGDTDSGYLRLPVTEGMTTDEMVLLADTLADLANESFPEFTKEAFCCTDQFSQYIKCGREVVATRGVFLAKKKYMLSVADFDGVRLKQDDKKAFKAMGMELAKSDTPKIIRDFLKKFSIKLLQGETYSQLEDFTLQNREVLLSNMILLGMPKSCNDLDSYTQKYHQIVVQNKGKVTIPGHVRAAINYNDMLEHENDVISPKIKSGDKVKVYYINLNNEFGFKSIALPADMMKFPKWFTDHFEIDIRVMEEKLIFSKLQIILNALNLPVPTLQNKLINDLMSFD